jgi:(2Fe-2S) ferredoxin
MRVARQPRLHLFVCANRREDSPLGPGCAERGTALYDALKHGVAARGQVNDVWVTKTHCLGICPRSGATVARYPGTPPILTDVEVDDAEALLAVTPPETPETPNDWEAIERELIAVEELQTKKVLELARRLKPGLTLEDVQNPHDFPELDDADWHYADGILTGMKSVTSALRALRRRSEGPGES